MTKTSVYRLCAIAPLVCSSMALLLVVVVLITGWERHLPDEGISAHLFQLLMAVQIPLIGLFLWTAKRQPSNKTIGILAVQLLALALPMGAVAAGGL